MQGDLTKEIRLRDVCALVTCYRKCVSLNRYWITRKVVSTTSGWSLCLHDQIAFSEGPQIILKQVHIGGVLLCPTLMYLEF